MLERFPYRGLIPYTQNESADFFGRHEEVTRCIEHLGASNSLVILGPPGIGKTSLIQAGIIPAIQSLNPPPYNTIVQCYLGVEPIAGITAALQQLDGSGSPPSTRSLLVIDNFEELYALADPTDKKKALFEIVRVARQDKVDLIIALRSDFFPNIFDTPELCRLFEESLLLLGPLSEVNLRQAISEPAKRAGIAFEEGLIDHIVAEATTTVGSLPLLQVMLVSLLRRLDWSSTKPTITLRAYQEIGSLQTAISSIAEDIWHSMSQSEQEMTRGLMLRLVTPEGHHRSVRLEDFSEAEREHINKLATERLVSLHRHKMRGSPFVSIVHESLFRGWPRFANWIDEEREFLKRRQIISEAATHWENANRTPSYLLAGGLLEEAKALVSKRTDYFGPRELNFINQSLKSHHQSTAWGSLLRRFGLSNLERKMSEQEEYRRALQAELSDLEDQSSRLQDQRSMLEKKLRAIRAENDKMSPQIFLSYASEDFSEVRPLFERLKEEGLHPWLDRENLLPGVDWDREISREIKKSHFVLVCLSQRSITKRGYVQSEIKTALKAFEAVPAGQTYLIPVRLEDCVVPAELAKYQYADIFHEDGFNKLVKSIVTTWAQLERQKQAGESDLQANL
jgi:hypothetical protein